MASSNVEFYQKQKDLQDSMLEHEQKRKKLEQQLHAYSRSDQKLSKLRAVRLQSYWKQICEDEKHSKQRNAQLLRDLDRMEANMASLDARREKLRHMKQQYFEYVERAYPQWCELVQKKKQEYILQQQGRQQQQDQQQQALYDQQQQQYNVEQTASHDYISSKSHSHTDLHNMKPSSSTSQSQQADQQRQHISSMALNQGDQHMYVNKARSSESNIPNSRNSTSNVQNGRSSESNIQNSRSSGSNLQNSRSSDSHIPKPSDTFITQQDYEDNSPRDAYPPYQDTDTYVYNHDNMDEDNEGEPPPLPTCPPPPPPEAFMGEEDRQYMGNTDREYTNLKDVRRDSDTRGGSGSHQPTPSSVTVHMPSVQAEVASPMKSGSNRQDQGGQNWLSGERDASIHSVSFSEEVEVPISQPVQSVIVTGRSKTEQQNASVHSMEPVGPMEPAISDEDVSDIDDEPEPLMQQPSQIQSAPSMEDDDSDPPPSPVHAEVSMAGLIYMIKYIEITLHEEQNLDDFYRSCSANDLHRKKIIGLANTQSSLQQFDGELVSMVALQQLTLVVRRLPGGCMLSDTLLARGHASHMDVRGNLHRDAQPLWDKLLEHFVLLVKCHAMGTREVAHIFVPCLVHAASRHQDTAVRVLEQLLENMLLRGDGRTSPQDDTTLDTARSSQQGGVPPLKFGSLVDSKPFTDDESSMITQSITTDNGPKVPLNETDAYKNLISGSKPTHTVIQDDTDTSDNDLEKQIVSTMTPRSHAGSKTSMPGAQNGAASNAPKDDSNDEREAMSDMSSPLTSPVYVPTGVDQNSTIKSILGSTGGSSQQRKLAGMIGSDLDSDTEGDFDHMVQKKAEQEDDDDDFDFYG